MTDYKTLSRPRHVFDLSDHHGWFPGWRSPCGCTPVCHHYSRFSVRDVIYSEIPHIDLYGHYQFCRSSTTRRCPFWFIFVLRWSSSTSIWIKTPEKTRQGKPVSGCLFNSVWHWCAERHVNASTDQIKQCSAHHCSGSQNASLISNTPHFKPPYSRLQPAMSCKSQL